MRKLVVTEFLSLDGVMQAPGSPDEDRSGGFALGGWQRPYFDQELLDVGQAGMKETDTYLFGRKTYEIMAAHWPTAPADDPFVGHLDTTPKYVVSRTLTDATWQNTELIKGDVVREIEMLKRRPGKGIAVLGSGELAQTLLTNDLVDALELMVSPIVLGSGKRLFRDVDTVRRWQLVESRATTKGNLILRYRPAQAEPAPAPAGEVIG